MKKEIISQNENSLFSRKEVQVAITAELTPSTAESRNIIAKEFKTEADLVRIRKIDSKFGSKTFTIIADIYKSQEEFNRVVKKTKQELKAIEEAKKAAEEAAKEAAEVKKAEAEAKKAEKEAAKVESETPAEEAN
ncbi:MAG: hypothetical protein PF542_03870 [Nanoarchaeota archaeon]|jgi:ribosomal protein S24E|nr:hypothetical protein [Nanoarchaeota archaeon]